MTPTDLEKVRVLLAVESLESTRGGIAKVARLTDRVLSELLPPDRIRRVTFTDAKSPADYSARGSKAKFLAAVWKQAAWSTHVVYDFIGMARAHPWLPGLAKPALCWIHGAEVLPPVMAQRLRAAHRMSTIVSNSRYTQDSSAAANPVFRNGSVCWLGTEEDDPVETNELRTPNVLILGRIDDDHYKGHAHLLKCWPRVTREVPGATLLVAGGGTGLDSLKALANGVPDIRFMGLVAQADLPALWKETSLFAMPSTKEGFGLVYAEAMRYGIPVIASVHDAAPEINLHGVTGFNVDLGKPDELPNRLIELLKDRPKSLEFGKNGQDRWMQHFRYSAFKKRFTGILERYLAK